jgi:hypothetical protein
MKKIEIKINYNLNRELSLNGLHKLVKQYQKMMLLL